MSTTDRRRNNSRSLSSSSGDHSPQCNSGSTRPNIAALARTPKPAGFRRFAARSSASLVAGAAGFPRLLSAIRARTSGSAAAALPRAAASGGTPVRSCSSLRVPSVTRPTPNALRHIQTLVMPTPHQCETASEDSVCTARIRSPHRMRDALPVFLRRGQEIGAAVQPPTSRSPSISSSIQSPTAQAGGRYGPAISSGAGIGVLCSRERRGCLALVEHGHRARPHHDHVAG